MRTRKRKGSGPTRYRSKRTWPEASADRCDSDEHHAFIAGYTAAGFAYGVTWDELENPDDDVDPDDGCPF